MLMSQGARSVGAIGCPNLGASAAPATLGPSASARPMTSFSSIDMAHLAVGIDPPARDGVAVLHGERSPVGRPPRRPALGNERFPRRLYVAGFIGRTALQDHRPPVPLPCHNGLLQCRLGPTLASVGRDLDLADPAIA